MNGTITIKTIQSAGNTIAKLGTSVMYIANTETKLAPKNAHVVDLVKPNNTNNVANAAIVHII